MLLFRMSLLIRSSLKSYDSYETKDVRPFPLELSDDYELRFGPDEFLRPLTIWKTLAAPSLEAF